MRRLVSLLVTAAALGVACGTAPDATQASTTTTNQPAEVTTTSAVAASDTAPKPVSLEASESAWLDEVAALRMPQPDSQLFIAYLVSWAHANQAETYELMKDVLEAGFAADNPSAVSTAPLDLYLAATNDKLSPLLFAGVDNQCGAVGEILLDDYDQAGVDCLLSYYEQRRATHSEWFQPRPSSELSDDGLQASGPENAPETAPETAFADEVRRRVGIAPGREQSMIDRGWQMCGHLGDDSYDNLMSSLGAGVVQGGGNPDEGLAQAWLIVIDSAVHQLCPQHSALWSQLRSDLGYDLDA